MAAKIEHRNFAILDINMGCPVPKVVNNGEGSALMINPSLAAEIVRKTVKAISKPVTVKFRRGFDEEHVNAVEFAKRMEDAGAAAVAVHGRTREQYYSGKADWDIIAKVKEAVSIPVLGNGDVTGAESAKQMLLQTGCDGIMVARAAQGNPWIFREITSYLEKGIIPERPSKQEMRELVLRHADLMVEYKGEYIAVREMRKHISWYTTGYPNSARLRGMINTVESMDELRRCVDSIFG